MDPGEKVEVNKLVEVVGQAPEAIHEIVGYVAGIASKEGERWQ